jgi:hypothetical protein
MQFTALMADMADQLQVARNYRIASWSFRFRVRLQSVALSSAAQQQQDRDLSHSLESHRPRLFVSVKMPWRPTSTIMPTTAVRAFGVSQASNIVIHNMHDASCPPAYG